MTDPEPVPGVGANGAEERVVAGRRVTGEVTVPGEVAAAEEAVLLAALANGDSRVRNVPPGVDGLLAALATLGVQASRIGRDVRVHGAGPQSLHAPAAALDLSGLGDAGLALLGLLAGQPFAVPVVPPVGAGTWALREPLLAMGARLETPDTGAWRIGGGDGLVGVVHALADPEAGVKQALLIGGLCARGTTSLRESATPRHGVERLLRERGVAVERRRVPGGDAYLLSVEGGQSVQAAQVEIPGDLRLAYPLLAPALARRNSEVIVRRVALRSAERGFLDLLRQMGGEVQAVELGNDMVDLTASSSALRPTRVAGQRAERVAAQAPLLAVLATQIVGECVIRDVPGWRRDEASPLGCLFEVLRQMGARVGEYPEGLVIKGGQPLQGARVDSRGSADLAMALGVAGMLAHGEMVIAGADCLGRTFPDYFAVLRSLGERPKERKR